MQGREGESFSLERIGVDPEIGKVIYDIEKRLPMDRVERAFEDEFSGTDPDIAETVSLLRKNTTYQRFLRRVDESFGGETTYAHKDYDTGMITHEVRVAATDDPDQDLHALHHEWLHGLSIGDVGRTWEEDGVRKQIVYARIGPKRVAGVLSTDQRGRTDIAIDRALNEYSPELVRFWEGATEWRARRFSMEHFPEKFTDFHASFRSGYQCVSLLEWLEAAANRQGQAEAYAAAMDQALVAGDDTGMRNLLRDLFPGTHAFNEIKDTLRQELVLEQTVEEGKMDRTKAVPLIQDTLYPELLQKLKAAAPRESDI